jgi:transposase InsO family protein
MLEVIDQLATIITNWSKTHEGRPKLVDDVLQPALWGTNKRTPSAQTAQRRIAEYGETLGQPSMRWKSFVDHVRTKQPKNH